MRRFLLGQFLSVAVFCAGVFVAGVAVAQEEAAPQEKAEPRIGTVTGTVLNVRARPARHYEIVAQLRLGDEVRIVDETDEWYEIVLTIQAKAWIAARFVGADGAVTGSRVRVHSGPGLVFTTFAYVNKGDKVELLGEAVNGWQRIAPPASSTAWISKGFVDVPEPVVPEVAVTEPEATGEKTAEEPSTTAAETTEETPVAADTTVAVSDAAAENVATGKEQETPTGEATEESPAGESETVTVSSAAATTTTAADTADTAALSAETVEGGTGETAAEEEMTVVPAPLPKYRPRPIIKDGIVLSLRHAATEAASHVLTMRVGFTCYTICFLQSQDLDFREWEQREVRVQGDELWYRGWQRPVIRVSSIQIKPTY